jgi:hypothetical protein
MSRAGMERGRQLARQRHGHGYGDTEPASDGEPVEPVDVDAADAPRDPDAGRLAAGQLARRQRQLARRQRQFARQQEQPR